MTTNNVKAVTRQLSEWAPQIIQDLKDDRCGRKPLPTPEKRLRRAILRKVMTEAQIRKELSSVLVAKQRAKAVRSK